MNVTGFRTIAFGVVVAIVPAVLTYLGGIDWTQFGINPMLSAGIGAAIVGLRTLTKTPIGKAS
jgi:hypothetical protein